MKMIKNRIDIRLVINDQKLLNLIMQCKFKAKRKQNFLIFFCFFKLKYI